jgi:glycosyltransferase involved in cell wall biosynthesis
MRSFSICIPNYNYGRYIGETIQSVLNQSVQDVEIGISDNASTDESVEIVHGFDDARVHLRVSPVNVGFAGNLDRAASLVSGDIMIMLSSDDLMGEGALALYDQLYEGLGRAGQRAVVASGLRVIDATGKTLGSRGLNDISWAWYGAREEEGLSERLGVRVVSMNAPELLRRSLTLHRTPCPFASTAYPRPLYEAVGGYGNGRLMNPDKWFAWKLLSVADRAYFIDAPLFAYRRHANNQAAQQAASGALKHLVDQYVATFDLPDWVLNRARLDKEDLARSFIEQDIALRGLKALADGQRTLARRTVRFGRAAHPREAARNWKVWCLRTLLALGPIGGAVARLSAAPAVQAWRYGGPSSVLRRILGANGALGTTSQGRGRGATCASEGSGP